MNELATHTERARHVRVFYLKPADIVLQQERYGPEVRVLPYTSNLLGIQSLRGDAGMKCEFKKVRKGGN
jgi:hypothetical protein